MERRKEGNILKRKNLFLQKPGGIVVQRIATAALSFFICCALFPAVSSAVDVTGSSNTYLQSRETADKSNLLPLYEYLDFSVQNTPDGAFSAHFGGWGRYDLQDESFGKRSNSDLQYGYLSYKRATGNSVVNLGRTMVFEGVAAERVDGVYARTDLLANFGVSAFGGVPVETETDTPGNNVIYGARLSHQIPGLYRIGVSALKEEKNSEDFRKEQGIDLWLRPVNKVELLGKSNYNAITKEWMEHTYVLVLGPFANVRLNTTASMIDYKSFFTGATSAAFFFDPVAIDPNEKVTILGEEVAYAVNDKLNLSVDYKQFDYKIAGNAKYFGGNIRYSVMKSGGAGLSIHAMEGDTDRLKYTEYRAYGFKKFGKTDLTLDALDVAYKEAINGVKDAYSVSLAAMYEVRERLNVGADVEYAKNPDFDKEVRGFFKLNYRFDLGYGKQKKGV